MKAVMISSRRDFAGSGYEVAQAIRQQGVDIRQLIFSISKHHHPYDLFVTPDKWDMAQKLIYDADIIHFKGDEMPREQFPISGEPDSKTMHIPADKPWVILLGGSFFRRSFPGCPRRSSFQKHPIEDYVRVTKFRGVITPDLNYPQLQGRYTPHAFPEMMPYCFTRHHTFVIGHSPSNASKKGTSILQEAINILRSSRRDFKFRLFQNVPYWEGLQKKAELNIYIDQLTNIGIYAKAAVEAMALGIPVLSYIRPKVAARSNNIYKFSPVVSPPSLRPQDIARTLCDMMDWKRLKELSIRSKQYAIKFHGYEPVGKLWVREYEKAIEGEKDETTLF